MKQPPSFKRYACIVATLCGLGHIGPAPGTLGSLSVLLPTYGLYLLSGRPALWVWTALLCLLSLWSSRGYLAAHPENGGDPKEIVIDEAAGQSLTLSLLPAHPLAWLTGFLLFRLLDIWKPWPIRYVDQHVSGAKGILLDDLIAGLSAGLLVAGSWRIFV